jgi:hypothetical protein
MKEEPTSKMSTRRIQKHQTVRLTPKAAAALAALAEPRTPLTKVLEKTLVEAAEHPRRPVSKEEERQASISYRYIMSESEALEKRARAGEQSMAERALALRTTGIALRRIFIEANGVISTK